MVKTIIDAIFPISSGSLTLIESQLMFKDIQKGDTFIKKNRKDENEYFILEGICRSYLLNSKGNDVTISFYEPQSIISPQQSRTKNNISLLDFQALTDLKIAQINAHYFGKIMNENQDIRQFGTLVLQNELSKKTEKEIGLLSMTGKERLLMFRNRYPMFENLIPHTHIASFLGITNISLSRLRGDLL